MASKYWYEWGSDWIKWGFVDSVSECLMMSGNLILIALILVVMAAVSIMASLVYACLCFYWLYVYIRTGDDGFIIDDGHGL